MYCNSLRSSPRLVLFAPFANKALQVSPERRLMEMKANLRDPAGPCKSSFVRLCWTNSRLIDVGGELQALAGLALINTRRRPADENRLRSVEAAASPFFGGTARVLRHSMRATEAAIRVAAHLRGALHDLCATIKYNKANKFKW